MADEKFNPHHKWLGISPSEFPYDHYRLLAIGRFENDADVIENAADQRMAHLRRMSVGSRSELAEALLNELSAAKLELLTPDRKKAYDAALKAKDAETKPAADTKAVQPTKRVRPTQEASKPAKALPVAAPLKAAAEPAIPDFGKSSAARSGMATRARRKKSNLPVIALLIVAALALGGGTWFVLNRPAAESKKPTNDVAKSNPFPRTLPGPQPNVTPQPTRPAKTADGFDSDQPLKNEDATSTVKSPPVNDTSTPVAELPSTLEPASESPSNEPPTTAVSTSTPIPQLPESVEPQRQPIPDESAQKTAREKMQGLFTLTKPRKPDERATLAKQLLEAAAENEDPAERYVVLAEASAQAAQGANVKLALEAVEQLGKAFEVSEAELALAVVSAVRVPNSNVETIRDLMDASLTYLNRAAEEEKFAAGADLADAGISAARRIKDVETAKQIAELKKQLGEQAKRFDAVVAAKKVLESEPDDPKANGTIGRYYAFVKGDWPRGLAHLSQSEDEGLAKLAQRDLAAPTTLAEQQAIASDWWKLAEQASAEERISLYGRAAHWYEKVAPQLQGVEQTHAEKRLAEAEKIAGANSKLASLPREQLIAYWKFDEPQGGVLQDSAGKHPIEYAAAQRVPGIFGTALRIEELSDFAARSPNFSGVTGSSPRTVAFWLKAESVGGIVSWGDDAGWWVIHVDHEVADRGKLRVSANGFARGSTLLDDGRWRHIAVVLPEGAHTHDGLQIYVDGKLEQTTVEGSKLIETGEGEVVIGTAQGIRALSGAIDELRIYARGLTEAEIARLARPPAK